MTRTHKANTEIEQVIMDSIRANENCTISDIVEFTGMSYIAVHRTLHGRTDTYTHYGLVREGKIEAIPGYEGKLCWLYSLPAYEVA